ncbi:MAG: hypothetical protein ACI9VR_004060 [Cognaticolwellia sp.]|jgi:uncharacterized protein YaiL (DUF2058 family)
MSLRDALLKSGAVSNKQVKGTERRLKKERNQKQSSKEKAKLVAKREAKAQANAQAEATQAKLEERIALAKIEAAVAQKLRLVHLIQGGHLRLSGGPARFFFVGRDDKTVQRLWVPWMVARGLRSGALAIALMEQRHVEDSYVVIERALAEQVLGIQPRSIRFFNVTPPEDLPELSLLDDWLGEKARKPA